jgi:drug/metabolite transporter (DMT)-like permease
MVTLQMNTRNRWRPPKGAASVLFSAVLFGTGVPLAKPLLGATSPVLLAGLLYSGAALGLSLAGPWLTAPHRESPLTRAHLPWLAASLLTGGVLGPVLLMAGLRTTPASAASLLLNLEGVFTTLLAWFVFRENYDRRIALGFALIVAGGVVLSAADRLSLPLGSLAVACACLCWALDNNLTQRLSAADPVRIAAIKGAVAGAFNVALGLALGSSWPAPAALGAALAIGFLCYGASLALYITGLRHLGTARTSAYFSVGPFFGAALAVVVLREPLRLTLVVAGALMLAGVWLHLTERHRHWHHHERLSHSHRHVHDMHHQHAHASGDPPGEPHAHQHVHEEMTHEHPHHPDLHHRHRHV